MYVAQRHPEPRSHSHSIAVAPWHQFYDPIGVNRTLAKANAPKQTRVMLDEIQRRPTSDKLLADDDPSTSEALIAVAVLVWLQRGVPTHPRELARAVAAFH